MFNLWNDSIAKDKKDRIDSRGQTMNPFQKKRKTYILSELRPCLFHRRENDNNFNTWKRKIHKNRFHFRGQDACAGPRRLGSQCCCRESEDWGNPNIAPCGDNWTHYTINMWLRFNEGRPLMNVIQISNIELKMKIGDFQTLHHTIITEHVPTH